MSKYVNLNKDILKNNTKIHEKFLRKIDNIYNTFLKKNYYIDFKHVNKLLDESNNNIQNEYVLLFYLFLF